MLYSEYHRSSFFALAVSFLLFLLPPLFSYSQNEEQDAVFILKGNTRLMSGKAAEGVDMELKKNGQTIIKIMSGKNGKYHLEMAVSTVNKNNEYILAISQAGTVPKTLSINTYISPEEFNANPFPRYEFDLEIKMIETTVKDIIVERASGKISWDTKEQAFIFDQKYAKIIQVYEDKMKDDNYLRELAEKRKKDSLQRAERRKDSLQQAEIDKMKRDSLQASNILQANFKAMKEELRRKRIQDSLDSLAALTVSNTGNTTIDVQKFVKPISPEDVDQNAFDGTGAYSINIAKKSLKAFQDKMNKEKAANLSAKYETNNTLTSLLNMVDEHDKRLKKQ